jgi:transposase
MESGVLVRLPDTEAESRRLLRDLCSGDSSSICPRCRSTELYRLGSGRSRCKRCHYTFSEFCGRWLNQSRLTCSEWVSVVSLFAAEQPVEDIARALGRAYATAFHAVTVLRAGILAHDSSAPALLYGNRRLLQHICRHRGRKVVRLAGHAPVFGIRQEGDTVCVPVLPDVSPELVLRLAVKKVRRGRIVYTGQAALYDTLMFSVSEEILADRPVHFCRSPVYIDGAGGFWAYAAPRLAAHHGISSEHFPLYLKELEFRYNHRREALEPLLLRYLCDRMPQPQH